jgi:hypothetical protein
MASSIRTNNRSSVTGNATLYGGLHAPDEPLVLGIARYLYTTSRRRA